MRDHSLGFGANACIGNQHVQGKGASCRTPIPFAYAGLLLRRHHGAGPSRSGSALATRSQETFAHRAPIFKRRYMSDKHIHERTIPHSGMNLRVGESSGRQVAGREGPTWPYARPTRSNLADSAPIIPLPVNLCQNQPARVPNTARAARIPEPPSHSYATTRAPAGAPRVLYFATMFTRRPGTTTTFLTSLPSSAASTAARPTALMSSSAASAATMILAFTLPFT